MDVCVRVYVRMYVWVYVCICARVRACKYIYIHLFHLFVKFTKRIIYILKDLNKKIVNPVYNRYKKQY